jgi:hypothetical protein
MNEEKVGIDHIYTCYRNIVGIKIPGNLEQSIRDTRTSKGWINYNKIDELSISYNNFVDNNASELKRELRKDSDYCVEFFKEKAFQMKHN